MTFPALDAFAADRTVGRLTFRLYMHLSREALDLDEARVVKVRETAGYLHAGPYRVTVALNWLVRHGYLIECDRGSRGVRRFKLAFSSPKGKQRIQNGHGLGVA